MKSMRQPGKAAEGLPAYLEPVRQAGPVHFDSALCTAGERVGRRSIVALAKDIPPVGRSSTGATSGHAQEPRHRHAA